MKSRSKYSESPYGKMRDRIKAKKEAERKENKNIYKSCSWRAYA